MSRTQVRVVIGLVIALHVALGLFFAPIGALDIEAETWLDRGYVACGAIVAQPVLLALWAALAPQPLAVRLPRAFELSALVCLALACGGTLNMGARMGGALETALVWGAIFSTALAALSLPRFFGWRIASEGDGDRMESRNQFTLRRLLGWTLRVSFLAAALRWLDGPVTATGEPEDLLFLFACVGAIGFLMGPVAALCAWLIFSAARRPVLKTLAILLGKRA